jgi:enterochelin esterase-like enzyme
MTLDSATGVWSYTTPMPPGTYTYQYYRNCTAAAPAQSGCTGTFDPSNPPYNSVGGVTTGTLEPTSQVYVPSDPAFGTMDLSQEAPNPVHGTVTELAYADPESTSPAGQHYLAAYTPPGYDPNRPLAYPTLYISHGSGGVEGDWFTQGVAGRIIDNLIASGKMQPAVVISTNFNGLPNGNAGYQADVLNRVIPFVEANFHVSHNASERAFGGLSAGGSRANQLIFNATTAFGYFATWSIGTGGAPAAGSALYANPELKKRLGLVVGGGTFDSITNPGKATLESYLTANGVPFTDDTINGGHEWYVWRQLLHDFAGSVAFRQTSVALSTSGTSVTATVTPGTAEPVAPTGTVQFSVGGTALGAPVAISGGTATIAVPDTQGASSVTATYSGDAFYNASSGSASYEAASGSQGAGGSVPATLALTLGAPASFGAFVPGKDATYTAQTTANVISTAGDATLSASDPGHLTNGAFTLSEPLGVTFSKSVWTAPVTNDPVSIGFTQRIGANEALRTGAYSRTLTFTLSTTTP